MVVGVEEPRVTSGVATTGAREYNVLSIGYKEQYNYTTSIEVNYTWTGGQYTLPVILGTPYTI